MDTAPNVPSCSHLGSRRVEQAFEKLVDDGMRFVADPVAEGEPLQRLRAYDGWVVPLQKGSNNILGMPTEGGGRNGLLFSAPDAFEAWLARCAPDVRAMVGRGSAAESPLTSGDAVSR